MKRALVTGASKGIGLALTKALLDDGWFVLGASRTQPLLKHERFHWRMVNLAIQYHVEWHLRDLLGDDPIDALIHAAAVQGPVGPFQFNSPLEWSNTIKANLLGTASVLRVALGSLVANEDGGRALLFSGGGAFGPRECYSAYAVSKAGVVSLMETVAAELARIGADVTVNCIAPGFVPTGMHQATIGAGPRSVPELEWNTVQVGLHLGDVGQMERVVACVRHLLSDATRGLSGLTISAVYDDWRAIGPKNVASLTAGQAGKVQRAKIQAIDLEIDGFMHQTMPGEAKLG